MNETLTNIRILNVSFLEEIQPKELECFRGAIVDKVGVQQEFYHNHNNDPNSKVQYHYRYPLIQYQMVHRRPRIVFINEAIEEAHHFFAKNDWSLNLAGRPYQSRIENLKALQVHFGLSDDFQDYRISNWLGLNEENVKAYRNTPRMADRLAILERILAGNILSVANNFELHFPRRFTLEITDFFTCRKVYYKGIGLMSFDLAFRSDVYFPYGLSMGKGSSLGYGRVGAVDREE
ncbi:MAG TPA: CRISPR-associated endonuclease Cas6 [Saprospiraceae bacterium]|nr:CRISPR-associated endonuclease Cas6 [Saprospiraceae bacterium]HMQ81514.1 CRISPR-associated endonuclease Cas6 [Saprospiraceae bacterium]